MTSTHSPFFLKTLFKFGFALCLTTGLVLIAGCSGGSSSGSNGCSSDTACCTYPTNMDTSVAALPSANQTTSNNTMAITVGCGYINEPCVSVTICEVGSTSRCRTIDNILLDTGSYGLRLFNCGISGLNLTTETVNGREVAECVSYADGSQDWGPVKKADIYLAGQKASNANFQYIDANYGTAPTSCGSRENNPALVGFNGILGVGLFAQDCGANCVASSAYNLYYTCSGASCTPSTMTLANQVANPVSLMPSGYNNGVVVDFTGFGGTSAVTASGTMTMGFTSVGTATIYKADSTGDFNTTFNGTTYGASGTTSSSAFIDSGSNGLFFPAPGGLPACSNSGSAAGFFCPASSTNFSSTIAGSDNANSTTVNFTIDNANSMLDASNPNYVFTNLGGNFSNSFDWGLPFFLKRKVYVKINGAAATGFTTNAPGWAVYQ